MILFLISLSSLFLFSARTQQMLLLYTHNSIVLETFSITLKAQYVRFNNKLFNNRQFNSSFLLSSLLPFERWKVQHGSQMTKFPRSHINEKKKCFPSRGLCICKYFGSELDYYTDMRNVILYSKHVEDRKEEEESVKSCLSLHTVVLCPFWASVEIWQLS